MKFLAVLVTAVLVAGLGSCNKAHAQVTFNGTYQVTPVNNGTGTIVSIPIGQSGLSVSVGTGSAALPLDNIAGAAGAQHLYLGDDSSTNVPLGFNFPYWGQSFNNSWMYSNGIVSFTTGNIPGAGCCSGQNLQNLANSRNTTYNYMIAPLWTDLIDTTNQSTWVLKNSTSATYGWYNTREYGTNNQSSFEVNINSTGGLTVKYGGAFVGTGHTVTAGMTGNLANGEYFQYYYGQGFNISANNPVTWGTSGSFNACTANPLSSPSCPGYTAAYTTQQCTISALYSPSCPGYQVAYTTQQCSIDPLYSNTCSGYQQAYQNQQCALNPLYSTQCSGYQQAYHDQQCSLNQLSYTDCPGYASAYLQQQCNANPLYSTTCSGYAQAYHDQQCSINPLYASDCAGYAAAYFTQQCTANPLYSANCPGYAIAYHNQQCTANPLYATDCPGYQQAYFNQQCTLNGLYNTQCPNYGTAYATQQALLQVQTQSTATTTTTTNTTPTTTTTNTTSPSTVAVVSNPTVNSVITTTTTTTNSAAAPAAAVVLTPSTPAATSTTSPTSAVAASPAPSNNSSSSNSDKKADNTSPSPTQTAGPSSDSGSKEQPKTARQELQERRQAASDKDAAGKGKEATQEMKTATSFESQKQVQGVVIQAMAFTPGFDVYKTLIIPDKAGYKKFSIYGGQKTVDNRALGRGLFGPTDALHNEMVESQYNRGN